MSSYRYRFVGYEKLPSGLNADDVQLHCRLPDRLVKEIRDSNYDKRYHLGLAVQLSFLALTGREPDSKLRMPPAMLRLLCEQLRISTTAIASLLIRRGLFMRPHRRHACHQSTS